MALAVERQWPAAAPLEGICVTRYRHGLPTKRIRVVEAGHPVPDEAGERAAIEMLAGVRELHIGHAIVSRAVFVGMREAVREMKRLMRESAAAAAR